MLTCVAWNLTNFLLSSSLLLGNAKFGGLFLQCTKEGVMIHCCISMHEVRAREGQEQGEGEEIATLC